tara:strand:+ start:44 stop:442 length:399 start_codon:yes stop_codon:yes gene_type:complete
MKIIKNGTYVSVPYALRKLIENYVVDDKLQVQDFDPYNWAEGNVTAIVTTGVCSQHYNINDKLYVEDDLEFWVHREGSRSWITTENLLVGDHLLTEHSKEERIDKLEHLDTVLEGCVLTSDSNFFASGYLVK